MNEVLYSLANLSFVVSTTLDVNFSDGLKKNHVKHHEFRSYDGKICRVFKISVAGVCHVVNGWVQWFFSLP
jgi:hypothetical protein